ncbi:MAG: hypothetical protein H6Q58_2018 [Firmicutes bacterium]|nr:hypothetical protein [Bacillota bacterium]
MNLLDMLTGQLSNQNTLNQLGQSAGADSNQVQQLVQLGLPLLMQAMGKNSSTAEGAQALTAALDQHRDADVTDIAGFLNKVDTTDGAKIVQHVLGEKNETVQNNLAKQTGMDASQVSNILTMLAPLLMGFLGQQKKEQNLDAAGISGLLTNTIGQSSNSGMMNIATQLLDTDKDGSFLDDVGSMLGKLFKK